MRKVLLAFAATLCVPAGSLHAVNVIPLFDLGRRDVLLL
jgi:hypothetical protein